MEFVAFGGSPKLDHGVDVTDTIDAGIASLERHRVYLDALPEGTTGTDPEAFLRGMATASGLRSASSSRPSSSSPL